MQLTCGRYGSALAAAAHYDRTDIVQLLLDAGADPNMKLICGEYGSTLSAAKSTNWNREDVLRLLLEHGAVDTNESSRDSTEEMGVVDEDSSDEV